MRLARILLWTCAGLAAAAPLRAENDPLDAASSLESIRAAAAGQRGRQSAPEPAGPTRVEIKGAGGKPIAAWVSAPKGRPKGVLLFVHGSGAPDGFSRDGYNGQGGEPAKPTWKDLRERFTPLGYATVYYTHDPGAPVGDQVRELGAVMKGAAGFFPQTEIIPVCHSAGVTTCETVAAGKIPSGGPEAMPRRYVMWGGGYDDVGLPGGSIAFARIMVEKLREDLKTGKAGDPAAVKKMADEMEADLAGAPEYFRKIQDAIDHPGTPLPAATMLGSTPEFWKEALAATGGGATAMKERGARALFLFGTQDPMLEANPAGIEALMRELGGSGSIVKIPGLDHFLASTPGGPIDPRALQAIERWLDAGSGE